MRFAQWQERHRGRGNFYLDNLDLADHWHDRETLESLLVHGGLSRSSRHELRDLDLQYLEATLPHPGGGCSRWWEGRRFYSVLD
ncbi:hypothetical protein D1871_19055 [Nakamurella silvestris]|nr:hypothetical protein D1871_19055 [Nakamurella silvestris]